MTDTELSEAIQVTHRMLLEVDVLAFVHRTVLTMHLEDLLKIQQERASHHG